MPGGGRPSFPDGSDLEAMKERMNRQREAFFNNAGHQPDSSDPFPEFFSRASPRGFDRPYSPGGFVRPPGQGPPRSFADRFSDMGGFPGNSSNMRTNNHHPHQQGHHPGAQQHHPPTVASSGRGAGDNVCGNSSAFDKCESIPIKVVHSGKPSSHRPYEGASHTTQIPVGPPTHQNLHHGQQHPDSYKQTGSPRLERAHSEPPKAFSQKLHRAQAASPSPHYMTIPEGHDIHMSASSPSVPSNRESAASPTPAGAPPPGGAAPQPPPRRATTVGQHPSAASMQHQQQQQPGSRKSSAEQEQPAVRHIPIVVEGRDEPVYSRRMAGGQDANGGDGVGGGAGPKPKPSDFYPNNVKRVPGGANPGRNASNVKIDVHSKPPQEPTSPLSPPTGPIPMGFVPPQQGPQQQSQSGGQEEPGTQQQPAQEPLSPQPIPSDVPIPMTWRGPEPAAAESSQNPKDETDNTKSDQPASGSQNTSDPQHPQPQQKQDPAIEKLDKVREAVKELSGRIEAFKGGKKDKEYLYLDEMLTRHLVSLDCIEANGRDDIRQMRKDTIKSINRCVSQLDHNSCPEAPPTAAADNNAVIDQLAAKSEGQAVPSQK